MRISDWSSDVCSSDLILLGLGWNFGFIGASALVLECHRPEEATRVQSFNDFMVFGTMAVGSFASGGLLATYGWETVLWVRSEEHTSELQSLMRISYAVFCLKKKNKQTTRTKYEKLHSYTPTNYNV